MGRLVLAFKTFFSILGNGELAEQIRELREESVPSQETKSLPAEQTPPAPPSKRQESQRSEALTLLETLQRDARFIDFIQEDVSAYSDQQIGAAVREVHRGCRSVFDRLFEIGPVVDNDEGAQFTVGENDSAARVQLIGKVTDERPATGELVHAGWMAKKAELPKWNGDSAHALIIAPAEVEVR